MGCWTEAEVLAASRAVDDAWPLPSYIEVVQTEDCLVSCRPVHLTSPTSGLVQAWINSQRPLLEMRPEVERLAQAWGADEVWRWADGKVGAATSESLRSAGASLAVTELVMARPLRGADADAWLASDEPPSVTTRIVADEEAFEALAGVETEGWGRPPPSADILIEDWVRLQADLGSCSAFALLGTMNGTPASVARCSLFDPVVRLFGAVTLPAFRQRGLYRSLVAARCRLGRANGAALALTKARPATSAPILERVGFRSYGVEQCWRLHVSEI